MAMLAMPAIAAHVSIVQSLCPSCVCQTVAPS